MNSPEFPAQQPSTPSEPEAAYFRMPAGTIALVAILAILGAAVWFVLATPGPIVICGC